MLKPSSKRIRRPITKSRYSAVNILGLHEFTDNFEVAAYY
jgi:hypothetical protein